MKFLVYTFIAISVYGLFLGKVGAALLALLCAGILVLFARNIDKNQAAQKLDPYWSKPNPDTLQELERQDAESSRTHF